MLLTIRLVTVRLVRFDPSVEGQPGVLGNKRTWPISAREQGTKAKYLRQQGN